MKLNDTQYEIIYAESKMYKNLQNAIDEAFNSIDRFISGKETEFEITTLATNLSGEFEDIDVNYISRYILPSKGDVVSNKAFNLFIGFEIQNNIDTSLDYDEFQKAIYSYVQKIVKKNVSKFIEKLSDESRKAYSFYIYLIPFTNIEETRRKIIARVKGEE